METAIMSLASSQSDGQNSTVPTTFLQNSSSFIPTYRAHFGNEEARYIANTNGLLAQYALQVNAILMTFNKAPASVVTPAALAKVASGSMLQVFCTSGTPNHIAGIQAFIGTAAVRAQTAAFYHKASTNAPQIQVTAITNLIESMLDQLDAKIIALQMTVASLFGPCAPLNVQEDSKHDTNSARSLYLLHSTQEGTALLDAPVSAEAIQATETYLASNTATHEGNPSWTQMQALFLENQESFARDAAASSSPEDVKAWLAERYGTGLWKAPGSSSNDSSAAGSSSASSSSRRSSVSSIGSVEFITESQYTFAPSPSSSKSSGDSRDFVDASLW